MAQTVTSMNRQQHAEETENEKYGEEFSLKEGSGRHQQQQQPQQQQQEGGKSLHDRPQ